MFLTSIAALAAILIALAVRRMRTGTGPPVLASGIAGMPAIARRGADRRNPCPPAAAPRGDERRNPAGERRSPAVNRFQVTNQVSLNGQHALAMPSVSVIVPALNEEESVDWVIDNIPAWVSEVILVDGLSVDGTELVVSDRRDDVVIVHQRTRGKGAALRAGFAAATGDIVVMIDADGSIDPREMGRFVDALSDGADFVKGSRNLAGGGSVDFTLLRHLGNLGFVHAANLLFGVRFTDLCYGYCAFWRRDLDRLALTADGFEIEMELVLSAVKAGLEIAEVPSMELERRAGSSNLNAWKDGKRVLRTLVSERVRDLDRRRAREVAIRLAAVELPAHGTAQWMPAGSDRRAHLSADRRVSQPPRAGYRGPERRHAERRSAPERTIPVLYAYRASDAVGASAERRVASRAH